MLLQSFGVLGAFAETTDGGINVEVPDESITTEPALCGDYAYWQLDDGVLTISGTGKMWNFDYFNDRPEWLCYASQVRTLIIKDGITSIGQCAFAGGSEYLDGEDYIFSNLVDIQIGNTVTTIYDNAFADCMAIEQITIPASVEYIGERVLSGCLKLAQITVDPDNAVYTDIGGVLYSKDGTALINYPIGSPATEYTIPNGTLEIDYNSFVGSVNLTKVNFNEGLIKIDDEAFNSCYNLTEAILPTTLEYLGAGAFQSCEALADIFIPNTVEHVGGLAFLDTAFCLDDNNWSYGEGLYSNGVLLDARYNYFYGSNDSDYESGHFDVAEGTRLIAQEAFAFTDLASVSIPDGVEIICNGAFWGTEIESVDLPNSLRILEDSVFWSCANLESVYMGENLEYIGSGVFNETPFAANEDYFIDGAMYYDNYLLDYDRSWNDEIEIREGTTIMAGGAFFNEDGEIPLNYGSTLTAVTIPSTLTTISDLAFMDCKNLTRVEIPSTVTEIGEYAFGYAYGYDHDLDIPDYSLLSDFTIVCDPDSAAEAYAKANGINYEYFAPPAVKAESINIVGFDSIFAYSGSSSTFLLSVEFQPADCETEAVTWESSNEDVATVVNGEVTTHNAGTATILARTESGLTDYIVATVEDIPYITLESPKDVTFTKDSGIRRCIFVPAESGIYTLSFSDDGTSKIDVYYNDAAGSRVGTGSGSLNLDLTADAEYMIKITRKSTAVEGGTLSVSKYAEDVVVPSPTVTGIWLTSHPNKTTYILGEPFDPTGMQVNLMMSDGALVKTEEYTISGYDPYTVGYPLVTISSHGYSASFNVRVIEEAVEEVYPTHIEVVPPSKTTYNIGDFLDSTGMVVMVHYSDYSCSATEDWYWEGYDPYTAGVQTITVNSGGFTDIFTITVKDEEAIPYLKSIAVSTLPSKTNYYQGDALNVSGGKVTLTYSDGNSETINLTDDMVSGYDSGRAGTQNVTVTYEGLTTTFKVKVVAIKLTMIVLTSLPKKLTYIEGSESLSVTGGKLTAYYNNGATKAVTLTKSMVSGFDNKKVGVQTLTVIYGEKFTTFKVTVNAKSLTGIEVSKLPNKTSYVQGDSISTKGMVVTAKYNNGTSAEVTGWTVSANLKTTGTKTVTVTYKRQKATFNVKVKALKTPTLKITGEYFKYKLNWNEIDGAEKYTIYYRLYSKGKWSNWKSLISTVGDITDYTHIVSVENDDKYQYAVKAINGKVKTDYSNVIKILPNPKKLVTSNNNKGIVLKWSKSKSIDGKKTAEKYNIYRRVANGKWKKLKTVKSTEFTDTSVKAKTSYQYRVRAVADNYESYYSSAGETRWLKTPSSIKASKNKKGISISWSKVSGASQYEVYRKAGSGKWTCIEVTKSAKFTDTKAKKGKTHKYRVRAIYGNSQSLFKTGKSIKR